MATQAPALAPPAGASNILPAPVLGATAAPVEKTPPVVAPTPAASTSTSAAERERMRALLLSWDRFM
jgi:hypothetical protein